MPPKNKAEEPTAVGAVRFGRNKNSLKFGLVGLPNVGKSSLFNLFCDMMDAAENYPFCTINPSNSRCEVPDLRFKYLCDTFKAPSEIPAFLQVTDIAGLVKGASENAGLGNAFLSHIQAVDGYFHVVRSFDNEEVLHVDNEVNPIRDMETISHELCLKDLEALNKCIEEDAKDKRKIQGKASELFDSTMEKIRVLLEADKPVRDADWSLAEIELIKTRLHVLITTKPCIYLVNLSAKDFIRKKNKWLPKIMAWINEHGGGLMVPISVEYEQELFALRDNETALQEQKKVAKSAIPKTIKTAYHALGLVHYFTAGEKEVRCWTIQKGCLAPQAAGVIHSDFEKGFIKAEICSFKDFKELHNGEASMALIKSAGKYKQEGKTYVVKDADIILFQFNVSGGGKKK